MEHKYGVGLKRLQRLGGGISQRGSGEIRLSYEEIQGVQGGHPSSGCSWASRYKFVMSKKGCY